jgi:hypothetical protein
MLTLPYLHVTQGKKPFVDYSKSHVMTSTKYLGILQKNFLTKHQQKSIVKQSKGRRRKIKPKKQERQWLQHSESQSE